MYEQACKLLVWKHRPPTITYHAERQLCNTGNTRFPGRVNTKAAEIHAHCYSSDPHLYAVPVLALLLQQLLLLLAMQQKSPLYTLFNNGNQLGCKGLPAVCRRPSNRCL
jgi:hypothetical protein